MRYFSTVRCQRDPTNSLQQHLKDYLDGRFDRRILESEEDLTNAQRFIRESVVQANLNHKRCKPLSVAWRDEDFRLFCVTCYISVPSQDVSFLTIHFAQENTNP